MNEDPVLESIATTGQNVEAVLRSAPDLGAKVPNLTWNVGEVGAHLVSILRAYKSAAEGGPPIGPDLRSTASNNARLLATATEETSAALADALDKAVAGFVSANAALGRDVGVPWYGETTITACTACGLLLGELLAHGYDLKGALGQTLDLDTDLARLAVGAYAPVLALMVDHDKARGLTATYEFRKAAVMPFFLVIEDGAASITAEPTSRGVDCRISFDPVAFVLTGRVPTWKSVLTGRVRSSGRRPWLASRLQRLLIPV
jgi:uncharacterized protein (TIGR03083 family)